MSRTVVIHQPDFLPYLGFFHRFLHADLWVILDSVQFVTGTSKSWTNRDKIKTPAGEKWITIAVKKTGIDTKISDVLLSDTVAWRENNLNLLKQNYRKSPFYEEIIPYVNELYSFQCERMIDFNLRSIDMILDLFNVRIEKVRASTLNPEGTKNRLLVDILKKVKADSYLSGVGAKAYFDLKPFAEAGISVVWQDFKHPVYPQLHGEFIPFLSSIDLLFNCGINSSRTILRS